MCTALPPPRTLFAQAVKNADAADCPVSNADNDYCNCKGGSQEVVLPGVCSSSALETVRVRSADDCGQFKECTINSAEVNLIKSFEWCCLQAYKDSVNICTIGWGHSANAPYPPHPNSATQPISAETAESYLTRDISYFENRVRQLVNVPLTSNQFSAVVSWTLNGGEGLLSRSQVLRNLNSRDYARAAAELVAGFTGNIVARKENERALFVGQCSLRFVPTCVATRSGVCNQPRC